MITFYPESFFGGNYYWGEKDVDAHKGWCSVSVSDWKWLYQDDNSQRIDYSIDSPNDSKQLGVGEYWPVKNHYYTYINRDPVARCL